MTVLEYLRELVSLTGTSGAEEDVARAVARLVRPLVDTVEVDALGTVAATRHAADAGARRLVLAAHIDEIGLRVTSIEPDGFLRFELAGGFDTRILLAQRVYVQAAEHRLLGVIGTRSAHLMRDIDRTSRIVPAYTEQYIDIGARDRDEARAMGVRIGDPAGFVGDLAELGRASGRFVGHALDDRAGCAVALALLDDLRAQPLPVTITVLFTVQEEIGVRGAEAARDAYRGDVGLAIDMTALDDTPETGTNHLRLGSGPAIKVMDRMHISHPAVRRGLETAATQAGIAVQHEILMGIGTDAAALQFAGGGTPTAALSVGNRYTHSPVEVVDLRDLEDAVALLRGFVQVLPDLDLRFIALE